MRRVRGGHPQTSTAPNGKRKHQRKSAERVPGHTLLPATRLENILRARMVCALTNDVMSSLLTAVL